MLVAYKRALTERVRRDSWTTMHEQLATVVELLSLLVVEIQAGLPVVQVRKQMRKGKPFRWPRPDWVNDNAVRSHSEPNDRDEIVVHSPRQLATILKGDR